MSFDWFTFGINNLGALMSGWFFEVSLKFYTVVVSAEVVGTFVAAAGLPPGTKLYTLIPQNNQP